MPLLHDCAQYSEEYDRLKLGIPTSSNFDKILTPWGRPSKQWEKYACTLIAERLLDRKIDFYTSPHMERGLIVEAEAVEWFEWSEGVATQRIGLITDDARTMGCSPDRLIGDNGLLEIKAPLPQTQIEYLITGKADRAHWPQLQGQLYVSQRQYVALCAWHPELPRIVIRVERDEAYIAKLDREIHEFNAYVTGAMTQITAVARPKASLGEMLRASLEIVP